MDILLIDPPYLSLKGIATSCGYNVGLTSLAAYLNREGVETAVLMGDLLTDLSSDDTWSDYHIKKYALAQREYEKTVNDAGHAIWKKIADYIVKTSPVAVGVPYYTPLKCVVERIARSVKEIDPDIKVIAGAFHPTFCPDDVMENPDIDFAVRGEGEIPVLQLVRELKKKGPGLENVPGIAYRDRDGRVRRTPAPALIEDLDNLPVLGRELILNCDYGQYRDHCLTTTRGCPYTCSFCGDKRLWGGRVRRRSVANVLRELEMLAEKYRPNVVDFVDGTFTYDRKYLTEFCNAVIDRNLDIHWRCTARYDNLDAGLIDLMKRAKCAGMYFGLESGSDRVLESVHKNITVREIVEVSNLVYNSGMVSATSVLLGLPDETREDMKETLDLMRKIKTNVFDVNSYVPLPGTPLYDAMPEEDRRRIDWSKVAYKSLDNYFSRTMSPEEFRGYLLEAYEIADKVAMGQG